VDHDFSVREFPSRRITRRRFLAATAAVGGGVLADASAIEPYRLDVSRHDVPITGLPAGLDGLRIAQISDVHLPGTPDAARRVVAAVERERPDLVVLTGDIIEGLGDLPALTDFASAVRGRLGTFAVLGNWEHKAGITPTMARAAYDKAEVAFLFNESAAIRRGGARLRLVGFDDPVVGAPDPVRALAGRASNDVDLWLIHGPAYADTLPRDTPVPAMILAGHTHGGQIRLPGVTLYTPPGSGRYVSGWYRDTLAPLYVSRGIGTATVRMRFCCRPELPIFTLRRR
jgi:predicted MPP superfamily phosphohydrolase